MSDCPCAKCEVKDCFSACGKLIGWRNESPQKYLADKELKRQRGES